MPKERTRSTSVNFVLSAFAEGPLSSCHACRCLVIHEPRDFASVWPDQLRWQCAWQCMAAEDAVDHLGLTRAKGNKGDLLCCIYHWHSHCDSLWRRLGRVFDWQHPPLLLPQQGAVREQGGHVAVRTNAKEDQIHPWELRPLGCPQHAILHQDLERLLIVPCRLLRPQLVVDRVDLILGDRQVAENRIHCEFEVAVVAG